MRLATGKQIHGIDSGWGHRGHPLAGPVSIGKIIFSTIFFKIGFPLTAPAWITKSIRIPVFDRVASVPNGSAPVTQKAQGLGRMPPTENSACPWQSRLPQKTSVPDRVHLCVVINVVALIGAARSVGQEVQHAGWQHYAVNNRFDGYCSPRSIFQPFAGSRPR